MKKVLAVIVVAIIMLLAAPAFAADEGIINAPAFDAGLLKAGGDIVFVYDHGVHMLGGLAIEVVSIKGGLGSVNVILATDMDGRNLGGMSADVDVLGLINLLPNVDFSIAGLKPKVGLGCVMDTNFRSYAAGHLALMYEF